MTKLILLIWLPISLSLPLMYRKLSNVYNNYKLTEFETIDSLLHSPSGKLVQIEYALAAVASGAPSTGIKASNGVVLATEKKHKSMLFEEHSIHKIEPINKHIGMIYSGRWNCVCVCGDIINSLFKCICFSLSLLISYIISSVND